MTKCKDVCGVDTPCQGTHPDLQDCLDYLPISNDKHNRWDKYFHSICEAVSSKSSCLSRKIGAILVRDHSIISTGYNGPPRGIPHCVAVNSMCPRRATGIASGEGMELCPAQHAEENCVSNAARNGTSTIGSTLYMNCIIPCQKCFGTLINAGIVEIVVDKVELYDKYTQFFIDNSSINIRRFQL